MIVNYTRRPLLIRCRMSVQSDRAQENSVACLFECCLHIESIHTVSSLVRHNAWLPEYRRVELKHRIAQPQARRARDTGS